MTSLNAAPPRAKRKQERDRIVEAIESKTRMGRSFVVAIELADELGLEVRAVNAALRSLANDGKVTRAAHGRYTAKKDEG